VAVSCMGADRDQDCAIIPELRSDAAKLWCGG